MEDNQNSPQPDMQVNAEGSMQPVQNDTVQTDAPASPTSVMDVTPPPHDEVVSNVSSTNEASAQPDQPVNSITQQVVSPTGADPVMPAAPANKSKKGAKAAIVILLALVLAAIAVVVYLKASDSTKTAQKSSNSSAQPSANKPAEKLTTTEVDTTAKDVDTALNDLDANKDFASDALSDKALGLQ